MKSIRCAVAIIILLLSVDANAKTATEVFDIASKSTVVVIAYDDRGDPSSLGSGVVLPDGSIATNCHVIKAASKLSVHHQGKDYPALAKHTDWERDICSIIVRGLKAPTATLGRTKGLKIGAKVYTISAPEGLELTLSEGIISGLRKVEGGQYIQTTAPISQGSSGGGLYDENGELLGLISFFIKEGQSLNFALPVEWIRDLPERHSKKQSNDIPMTECIEKALRIEKEKDWDQLEIHAKRWIEVEENCAEAWFYLGVAYGGNAKLSEEIEAYKQALRIDQRLAKVWYRLGLAYMITGKRFQQIEAFEHAISIDPEYKNGLIWFYLGSCYKATGQTLKAIEAYEQLLRINPKGAISSDVWYDLGRIYKSSGDSQKVMEVYYNLKELDPDMAKEFFNKVVLP